MNSLEAAGSKRSLMSWRDWKGKRRTKEKCCHVFHVRYPVKKISRWEQTGFEKEKKQVYCTIRIIFYILIILPFYFLLQVSCFLIILAIVRVGGNKVESDFVKPWDEYMCWCDTPTVPSFTCSLNATVTPSFCMKYM